MPSDYTLLDCGGFEKLERVGPFTIVRPSPQAVWKKSLPSTVWEKVDAKYHRNSGGDGKWTIKNPKIKEPWSILVGKIRLEMRLTDFGHLGIFSEQADNWNMLSLLSTEIQQKENPVNILNLFAYTGGSTFACALAGARMVHVDASKTSVAWARQNAALMNLDTAPIRWIVEDVKKFVGREVKRNSTYHGVILDPPSYGRGNKGENWKIEEDLPELLEQIAQILHPKHFFVQLSAHSNGYTPLALENILRQVFSKRGSLKFASREMQITVGDSKIALPSGATCTMSST